MAKRNPKLQATKEEIEKPRTSEWRTSRDVEIRINSLPPLLMASLEDVVEFPVKPTYSVETVAGDIEIFEHSEETIKDPATSAEDKLAWTKYKLELNLAEEKLTDITLKTVLYEGVTVVNQEEQLARWCKKRRLIGLPVPEDDEEALLEFKETEVIGTNEDMEYILAESMRLTGVSETVIEAASRSFQDPVESGA